MCSSSSVIPKTCAAVVIGRDSLASFTREVEPGSALAAAIFGTGNAVIDAFLQLRGSASETQAVY